MRRLWAELLPSWNFQSGSLEVDLSWTRGTYSMSIIYAIAWGSAGRDSNWFVALQTLEFRLGSSEVEIQTRLQRQNAWFLFISTWFQLDFRALTKLLWLWNARGLHTGCMNRRVQSFWLQNFQIATLNFRVWISDALSFGHQTSKCF